MKNTLNKRFLEIDISGSKYIISSNNSSLACLVYICNRGVVFNGNVSIGGYMNVCSYSTFVPFNKILEIIFWKEITIIETEDYAI